MLKIMNNIKMYLINNLYKEDLVLNFNNSVDWYNQDGLQK